MLLCQAMHEVNLGAYGPLASRRGALDLLNDVLGRAVKVSCLDNLAAAFRMNQYLDAGILGTRLSDLLHIEAHMRGTVALPEDNARALDLFISVIRGHGVFGIPNYHLLLRYAEFERGVPAQVFVGEEEYALATAECPLDHSGCVRGGADDSAIAPAESFQVGRLVHVGDRDDAGIITQDIDEHLPALFYLGDIRHVSH